MLEMKKIAIIFVLLASFAKTYAFTGEAEIDGLWYYIVTKGKTATVIRYKDMQRYTGDIVIPDKVNYDGVDCTVTGIENYAFIDCPDITSVVIPNTVATIGEAAFSHCTKLTGITIPNSVPRLSRMLLATQA